MAGRWRNWLRGAEAATPPPAGAIKVLMVCMGNICRSPTAEGVLRAKLQRAGLDGRVHVDSAGTHGFHTSEPPDRRAIRHAAQRGYDIAGLRARPVLDTDFQHFDWVLAMDGSNLSWLEQRQPEGWPGRMELLLSHARPAPPALDVPDPYYGTAAGFDKVLDLVELACDGLLDTLREQLAHAERGRPMLD